MKYVTMAGFFLLAACDKDHVCECRMYTPQTQVTDSSRHVFRGSKASAENSCVALERKKSADRSGSAECEITGYQQ